MKERIESMIEEKLNPKYETYDETTKTYMGTEIDWGFINEASLVPKGISVDGMIKVGATNVSSVSGREYQGSKAYSVRGISHCVLKRHSPLIVVSNEVRNYLDRHKSTTTPITLAC